MTKSEKDKIYKHLDSYKKNVLKVNENGVWVGNGKPYPHILPFGLETKNYISLGYLKHLLAIHNDPNIKKHRSLHHLNSSQALAFNLFEPLRVENNMSLVLGRIGVGGDVVHSEYEHIENGHENTNFDFFVETTSQKVFFEVKYTEDRFGSASEDKHHNKKYREIYRDLLEQVVNIEKEDFFSRYQLWRNICYSAHGTVVFVFPRFRDDLTKEVEKARSIAKYHDRIKILYIDDICDELNRSKTERLSEHYLEFQKKYLRI